MNFLPLSSDTMAHAMMWMLFVSQRLAPFWFALTLEGQTARHPSEGARSAGVSGLLVWYYLSDTTLFYLNHAGFRNQMV